jgi:hypothetical protein
MRKAKTTFKWTIWKSDYSVAISVGHALERDILELKKTYPGWALVAHTYNPSYSEGRDQKDGGLNSV